MSSGCGLSGGVVTFGFWQAPYPLCPLAENGTSWPSSFQAAA